MCMPSAVSLSVALSVTGPMALLMCMHITALHAAAGTCVFDHCMLHALAFRAASNPHDRSQLVGPCDFEVSPGSRQWQYCTDYMVASVFAPDSYVDQYCPWFVSVELMYISICGCCQAR